jgi:NTE family protein
MRKKLLYLLLFSISISYAQPDDLKVGLVLSGGGAKGIAHVGALKVIEESGVRIDYIGGSSMGAVVGALYAAGYSANQIENLFLQSDLNLLIKDQYPRRAMSFTEKEDRERYAITLPFDHFQIKFPSALSRGQDVYNLLVQLLHDVHTVKDFDNLPIPFFCTATDIETGELVVLDEGFLPLAVNASSALPTLFSPVAIGDKLFIDGGVADNYPLAHMQAQKVDFIIGVDVQSGLIQKNELQSAADIMLQISGFESAAQMKEKKAATDLYIHPDVSDYNLLSFEAKDVLVQIGQKEASRHLKDLASIAELQTSKNSNPPKTKSIAQNLKIDRVAMPKLIHFGRNYLNGKLRIKTPTTISYEKFQRGLTNLAATNNFKSFRYQLDTTPSGTVLDLNLEEVPNDVFLKIGVHYDDLFLSSALINLTWKHGLFKNDELSFDMIFGDNVRYQFDYYIDKGLYWSIGLHSRLNQFSNDIQHPLSSLPTLSSGVIMRHWVQENEFLLGTLFREAFRLNIGVAHQRIVQRTNLIESNTNDFLFLDDSDYYSLKGNLSLDTRDHLHYPTQGGHFYGSVQSYLYKKSARFEDLSEPFLVAQADMSITKPLASKLFFTFGALGGFTVKEPQNNSFRFLLGGYGNRFVLNHKSFLGYAPHSLSGNSFVQANFNLDYNFHKKHHVFAKANFARVGEDIYANKEWLPPADYSGFALGYGLDSLFGPLELTWSYSPEVKRRMVYVNVGWWF